MSGVRCPVSGVRCPVSGVRCPVSGAPSRAAAPQGGCVRQCGPPGGRGELPPARDPLTARARAAVTGSATQPQRSGATLTASRRAVGSPRAGGRARLCPGGQTAAGAPAQHDDTRARCGRRAPSGAGSGAAPPRRPTKIPLLTEKVHQAGDPSNRIGGGNLSRPARPSAARREGAAPTNRGGQP